MQRHHLATFLSKTTNQEPAGDLEEESHFLSKNRPDVHRRLRWLGHSWKRVFPNYGRRITDHGNSPCSKPPAVNAASAAAELLTMRLREQLDHSVGDRNGFWDNMLDSLQALTTRAAIFRAAWLDGFHRGQLLPRFYRCYVLNLQPFVPTLSWLYGSRC